MKKTLISCLIAGLTLSLAAPAVLAGTPGGSPASPVPSPYDKRIRVFTYSPEMVYNLHCAVGMTTQIALAPGEGLIEDPHVGDSIEWRITGGPTNIYIKPVRPDITTSLSLVTNKRIYQFQLFSGGTSDYEQMVSFHYPREEEKLRIAEVQVKHEQEAAAAQQQSQLVSMQLNPTDLSFAYDVKGDAPFRPLNVFNDGKFTYLLMPKLQDLPAAFLVDAQGKLTLVNYIRRGSYLVIERVASQLMLKLGKEQVEITLAGGRQ